MPIINFTPADKLASKILEGGWYTAQLESIEQKKSGSGKSVNFFNDIKIVEGPFTEKIIPYNMSTGSNASSVLGTMQWNPHSRYNDIAAAISNCSIDDVPLQLNTDTLLHKPFDIKVEKGIYEGVVMNTISGFLPAGKGAKQEAPF